MKRTTALILALLMCVSMMPNVFAFTPETVESAAETVPGSESAALAVSNDPAVLGDNYLVDGLGKALLYVSGETMKYDFLDSTYITGHKIYDDGARDIQYFEAGSSASLASDPKDASKTVTKLVTGSAYGGFGFGALYFDPGQFNFQKGKYTGRADMFLDPASYDTATYAFLCRTQVYKGTDNGSDSNSGLDLTLLKNGEWNTCTSAIGTYDGSKYNYNNNAMEGDSVRFLAFGINGPQGTTSYLRNIYYYFYPANSFMIKGTDGKLQLIELSEGDIYTFPAADGDYVYGSEVYKAGDKIVVSELEYKTFTVGGTPVIVNDGKTPGINIATGNQNPLTFDEEPALTGFTGGADNSVTAFDVEGVTGNEDGGKAFKVSVPTNVHYMSVYYNKFIEAYRPYFVKFDVYSNHSPDNACMWLIDGNRGNGGDHVSLQNGFAAAIKDNKWYTAAATARYSVDRSNIQIQVDSWWGNPSAGHDGTYYYYDNLSIVPYYKVSYIYNGAVVDTAYVNSCENDGTFRTELPLDLTKTLSVDGKKLVGWSLNQNSTVADAPEAVAAANRDIKLYAVVKDVGVTTVTFMNGEENLGSEDLNFDSLITKFTNADGKLFKGWSTTPDGANMISRVPENDTTLYAVFENIATENEYGTLIYYNDFSNTAFAAQEYTGWTHDNGSTATGNYNFFAGNYKNDALLGPTYTGNMVNGRAKNEIVNDPAGTAANPVLKMTQTGNYPRFETFFTNKGAAEPSLAAGTYTITYKVYVPASSSGANIYTVVQVNNTDDTGTDWGGRYRKFSFGRDSWISVTEKVNVPNDYAKLGKLGFFSLAGDANGNVYYLDDYAIYYAPSVTLTYMNGEAEVASKSASVGAALPVVLVQKELKSFLGWSTDGTKENILTTVPETNTVLHAVFEDVAATGDYGTLLYYTDFSSEVYEDKPQWDNNGESNQFADSNYDPDGNGTLSTRTWFATYENAYDPAGSGNPVLKVNKKNNNSRPTIKFSAPLASTGFYTITGKVFVPKGQSGNNRLYAYADTVTDGGNSGELWNYVFENGTYNWDSIKINYTEGEWKEFSRTFRVPEDIPSIGQIGIINSLNNTQSTYYIDDLAVWYQAAKAPTASNDVSIRVDSVTGIRFSASVSASLKASALEYGFIVTRKSVLDTIGKTANDLKFDLTAEGYETSKLYASGVAYQKDDEGNVLVDKQYDVDTKGNVTYTAVCTGIPKASYSESIVSRPYIRIAMYGKVVTAYGKAVTSSMKEAAQAVKDAGGAAYEDNKAAIDDILNA